MSYAPHGKKKHFSGLEPTSPEAIFDFKRLQAVLKLFRKCSMHADRTVCSIENPVSRFRKLPCVIEHGLLPGWRLHARADHCRMASDLDQRLFPKKPSSYLLFNVRTDAPLLCCEQKCSMRIDPISRKHKRVCCRSRSLVPGQSVIETAQEQGLIPQGLVDTLWKHRVRHSLWHEKAMNVVDVGVTELAPSDAATRNLQRVECSASELWHQRFGHCSSRRLQQATRAVTGMPANIKPVPLCTACAMSKQSKGKRTKCAVHRNFTATRLSQVSIDLHGPYPVESLQGGVYEFVAVDSATGYVWTMPMRDKSSRSTAHAVQRFFAQVTRVALHVACSWF